MTEQTATERLRAMLDERGVEYEVSVENATGFEHVIWHPNKFSQWDWNEEFGAGWLTGWQQGITPEQAIAATLGNDGLERSKNGVAERGTCKEVYLLMAMDIGDGKDEVLGVYATESAAMEAAKTDGNQFGYAFHNVCKWEVVE